MTWADLVGAKSVPAQNSTEDARSANIERNMAPKATANSNQPVTNIPNPTELSEMEGIPILMHKTIKLSIPTEKELHTMFQSFNRRKPLMIPGSAPSCVMNTPLFHVNDIPIYDPAQPVDPELLRQYVYRQVDAVLEQAEHGAFPQHCHSSIYRGLVNTKNLCFLHSTIQVLLAVPELAFVFSTLADRRLSHKATLPMTYRFTHLVARCRHAKAGPRANGVWGARGTGLVIPPPTAAEEFHDLYGRTPVEQQDAHEFLQTALEELHREFRLVMAECRDVKRQEAPWSVRVGGSVVQTVEGGSSEQSLVTALFGGSFRSTTVRPHAPPSVTAQMFTTCPVNVITADVTSVKEAMAAQAAPEQIESSAGTITRTLLFDKLPETLVIHISRAGFDPYSGEYGKVRKAIVVDSTLELDAETVTRTKTVYSLTATVDHHGKRSERGHFTASLFMRPMTDGAVGRQQWLLFNDAKVRPMQGCEVTGLNETAYLLFYTRES
ncbi:Ubiquitin carboxyl-terminal hydrolase [Carpediemonas membranifera]|uniref:ubiquitinyl hydrolase 1 n=1 Tax=Carpediemonas membranifera TaxID=201153 RepID=A0A8J6B1K5_9EUKA|nr:Ubiquitin carboxyl-terminal hydrolase [Carpediemonas membranifera]|eukprot:KAG9390974.1 Ubiquitin carboxyl-terminal hydrolase [Carpediemonas membranifera]